MEEILEKPSEYRVEDRFGRTEPEITGLITSGSTGNVPFLRQLLTVKYGLHNGLVTSSSGYGFSHLEHAEADAMFDRWSVRSVYKEKRKALEQMLAQIYLHYRRWRRRAAFLTWSAHLHPQAPEDLGEVGALLAAAAPPPGPASEEPEPEEEEQDEDRSPTEEEEGEEVPPAPSPPPPLLAAAPVHRRPCRCVRCLRKYGRVGFRPARHRDTMACSESACSVNEHLKRRLAAAKDFMARQEEKCKTLETNTHWQLPAHQQVNGHLAQISGKTRLRSGASKSSTEARHRKNEQKGRGQKNVLDGPDLLFKDPRSQVLATEYILTMQQASSSSRPNSSKNTLSNKVRDPRKVATDVIMAMMVGNENDNNSGNNPYDNTKMRLKPEEEEKPAAQPSNKTLDFGEKGESAAQVVINNKHETLEEEGGELKNGGEGGRKKDKKSSIVCLVPNSLSEEEILLLEKEEYLKTELVSGDENVNEADEKEEPLPAVVVKFVSDHQDEVRSNVRVPSTRKNSDDFNTNDDGGGSGDERDGNVRSSSSCTNTAMKSGENIHGDHATSPCTTEKDILR